MVKPSTDNRESPGSILGVATNLENRVNPTKIVWYRKTEQEARVLAASDSKYEFIGQGYNPRFPDLWAVKVYERTPELEGNHEDVGC